MKNYEKIRGIFTNKKINEVIKKPSFNLKTASKWWQSNNGESKGGSFNIELYRQYLNEIYK